ncbi:polyamine ABC transporter ATP-binding protein [Celerinatantimonas sp. YJH-8]|uniref:polyamine ABC transporter ATP-binding protein n=1 Tax=Celerinatantimonas sp. YJH-8 TaxID=3228714 RepID=UPI0038C2F957
MAAVSRPPATRAAARTPLLEIRGLSKLFDGIAAVDDVDLTIHRGEIFALLGGSGCGKSTLLRMLAGFEVPSQGEILLDGQRLNDMAPYERPVNMMFQSYALFPHMNVADNIGYGLKQDRLSRAEIRHRVDEMLELVHMREYARRKPHQLSGGQRQRVALARSLAKRPKLLLLDEPMGALDKKLRSQMQLEVVNIIESVGVTCVMVTHDQEEAMTMAERIAIMNRGEFVQIGTPEEIYEQPNSRYSAEFLGATNIFEGQVRDEQSNHAIIHCPQLDYPIELEHGTGLNAGSPLMIAVRPEKMLLQTSMPEQNYNVAFGMVEDIAYLGSESIYHIRLDSGLLIIVSMQNISRLRRNMPTWDDPVWLSWEADNSVVLML